MPIVYYTYIHTYIYIAFCRRVFSSTGVAGIEIAGIAKERCFTFIIHQEIDA